MSYEHIQYHSAEGVATITLNRPERLNAWTDIMDREVREAMRTAEHDDQVRVIVLTGAGRGFCAGADMDLLTGIQGSDKSDREAVGGGQTAGEGRADYRLKYTYFPAVSKPVIGALHGPVAGLGMVLALYCDLRIAADDVLFTTAFSRRGLIAEHGIAWLLPRLVGTSRALDLLISARKVYAREAAEMGLVNRLVPADQLAQSVREYAADLASNVSPRSMAIIKQQVWEAPFQSLAESVETANREMLASFDSEDFREGVAHFVEKRPARFTGK